MSSTRSFTGSKEDCQCDRPNAWKEAETRHKQAKDRIEEIAEVERDFNEKKHEDEIRCVLPSL